ncbi:hypothetical protein AVDCRST_MAG92-4462 [uncultured Coleofasciculus sp.]|uniref:Uncharacterized protein n=1 Tax=uncultured Coleofasciculus sp. TaxID=1267456 RepID=A0A6J4K131_9CYAN|nr:hypothetical protein AVDCRST_MAG92-4462 [uncultured Coleofasciculus sp.]
MRTTTTVSIFHFLCSVYPILSFLACNLYSTIQVILIIPIGWRQ